MNKFAEIAKRETSLSRVMEGREKMSVKDVIKKWPDGFTVTEFDFLTTFDSKKQEDVTYPVIAIKEDPKICFFGGAIIDKILKSWVAAYDGDIQAASDDLKADGGVKIRMYESRTKNGNNLMAVEVIE